MAKSGTSDFLASAETTDGTGQGNLIGAFGLGFYSSFLVADRVHVASIPPKSAETPEPVQHVFTSDADDSSFEIFPDPRGNTLGRGTEITLYLKPDALEYLENSKIIELMYGFFFLKKIQVSSDVILATNILLILPHSRCTCMNAGWMKFQMRI